MSPSPALSRLKLLGLALAFFGPLIVAATLYSNSHLLASRQNNHGELIIPAQPLAIFDAVSTTRQKLPADLLTGKWTLLYWNDGDCRLSCEAALFKMRQVRLSLNKDIERVQTLYLSASPRHGSLASLRGRHPQLVKAHFVDSRDNTLARQINAYPKDHVYVIDPLGNLMMRYASDSTSKGMLKDLKKLLRVSRIG